MQNIASATVQQRSS